MLSSHEVIRMKLDEFFDVLMFDSSPGERLRLMRVLYRLGVIVFIVWTIGVLSPLGLNGLALADEVDRKIKVAIDPINEQLAEIKAKELSAIKTKLEESERIQKRILAAQISSQLRDLNRLRCSTGDPIVRARMEQDIEAAEQEYRGLTAERYPLPACKDL